MYGGDALNLTGKYPLGKLYGQCFRPVSDFTPGDRHGRPP
jgi:hypothetical protein